MIQKNNSVIFRDVDDLDDVIDLTANCSYGEGNTIILTENSHYFSIGDAIYYDFNTNHYRKGLAVNQIMSEIIGVVSKIIDKDTFELTTKGSIILDRYDNIENNSVLYLSSNISGRLVPNEPDKISKIIGIKINNGIRIDIQRGYHLIESNQETNDFELRYYTQQELQNIVTRVMTDIY